MAPTSAEPLIVSRSSMKRVEINSASRPVTTMMTAGSRFLIIEYSIGRLRRISKV